MSALLTLWCVHLNKDKSRRRSPPFTIPSRPLWADVTLQTREQHEKTKKCCRPNEDGQKQKHQRHRCCRGSDTISSYWRGGKGTTHRENNGRERDCVHQQQQIVLSSQPPWTSDVASKTKARLECNFLSSYGKGWEGAKCTVVVWTARIQRTRGSHTEQNPSPLIPNGRSRERTSKTLSLFQRRARGRVCNIIAIITAGQASDFALIVPLSVLRLAPENERFLHSSGRRSAADRRTDQSLRRRGRERERERKREEREREDFFSSLDMVLRLTHRTGLRQRSQSFKEGNLRPAGARLYNT